MNLARFRSADFLRKVTDFDSFSELRKERIAPWGLQGEGGEAMVFWSKLSQEMESFHK